MISFVDSVILKELKLNYGKSVFSNQNEELIFPIPEGGFTPDFYARRHVILTGSFKIDWMVGGTPLGLYHIFSEEDRKNLLVFPYKHQTCDAIRLTSLEPNSSYLCIVPLMENKYRLVDESFSLDANQDFKLIRGRLYVCNTDLIVNGNLNIAYKPFACIYNEIIIKPSQNSKLASFMSVEIT